MFRISPVNAIEVLLGKYLAFGLLNATAGDVEVLGQRWGHGDDRALRQRIGISLQETKLTEKLNVIETLRDEGKTDAANAVLVLAEKTYSRSRRHEP